MSDRDLMLILSIVLVVVSGFYIVTWSPDGRGGVVSSGLGQGAEEAVYTPLPGGCGELVDQCLATSEVKVDSCDRVVAKKLLTDVLGLPLKTPSCKAVQKKMESSCDAGCELDYGSLIAVPGDIRISTSAKLDEFGQCLARGSRQVSLKARCRKIPN